MEISKRPYSQKEIRNLKAQKFSYWDYIEHFFTLLLLCSIFFIIPIYIYNEYIQEIPSHIEKSILSIGAILIIIYSTRNIYKDEYKFNKDIEFEIDRGTATVYAIKTEAVVIREAYEDFGLSYYIQLPNNKVLYLDHLYLGDFEIFTFPLSEFEIVRGGLYQQIINIHPIGTYIEPLKTLAAFSAEEFQNYPFQDGDILDITIDEIV